MKPSMKNFIFLVLALAPLCLPAQDTLFQLEKRQIYFQYDEAVFLPGADSVLQETAAWLGGSPERRVRIRTHADARGSLEYNQALSEQRAEAVRDSLLARGVLAEQLIIAARGEQDPVADNETAEGRQANRRADLEWGQWIRLTPVQGQITDDSTGQGIAAEVILRSKIYRDTFATDSTGFFEILAPEGEVIGLEVVSKGYLFETQMLKVTSGLKPIQIPLGQAYAGAVADLQDLFFVGNQDTLLEKSMPALFQLLRFMQVNSDLKVEIGGHINHPFAPPVDITSWNYGLSLRRAKRVYQFLIDNGISPDRMTFVGYGNWQMRYPRPVSEWEQSQNRRVEIKVTE